MRVIHSNKSEPEQVEAPDKAPIKKRRAGIYLLPNLFTTSALFAGFYGIVSAINGRFEAAAVAILIAMVFDGIDGRIARMTNTQSDFGAEYDSLADMASFGLAPALIAYEWALFEFGKFGWLAAFIYTSGAALRLARFNTEVRNADKRFFQGLPSPAAAGLVATVIWFGESVALRETATFVVLTFFVTVATAVLMVSNVRYYSFKDFDLKSRVPFVAILAMVLVFVLVSIEPATMLLALFGGYTGSGLILTSIQRRRTRTRRRAAQKAE